MSAEQSIEVLLITGPPGVGKSSAAEQLSDLLCQAAVEHAVIDLDELDRRGAHHGPDLHFENLSCIWRNYAKSGVRRLVVAWTLDRPSELESLRAAVPAARVVVCQLRAQPETAVERAGRRETPMMREQLQALALKYASRMDRDRPDDIVIETDGRQLPDIALELGQAAGWLSRDAEHGELPLAGGRLTSGVVRIGETVRRPASDRSEFVRELLRQLEAAAFDGAPRFLGIDGQGRDTLTFIEGWVPPNLSHWADEQLASAAKVLRRYHDATAGTALAGDSEVVCHNDPSPCNFVFQRGRPCALIDFDHAAPGQRLDDVAYACWMWTLTTDEDEMPLGEQARQVALFVDAYGIDYRPILIDAIQQRQQQNLQQALTRTTSGDPATAEYARASSAWQREQIEWLATRHDALNDLLSSS